MFYTVVNIIFMCLSLGLIFIAYVYRQNFAINANTNSGFLGKSLFDFETKKFFLCTEKYFHKIVLVLFLITIFTSVFKLGEVPYGLNVDEAGMAYDALCIVNYGTDRYLNPYPVYFINYGDGQNAMYTYIAAFLINIFDYSKIVIRLPAVFLRFLTFIAIFFLMKNKQEEENYHRKTLLFLFLFSICPYFIMQSRWGLESNLLVGFLTISVCILVSAVRTDSTKLFFLSGVAFGLTLYTYALSYIIIPIFLFSTCIYLVYCRKIAVKQILFFFIPCFLLAIPLLLMILVNNKFISEIKGIITIPLLHFYRGGEVSFNNIFENIYVISMIFSFDNPIYYGKQLIFNAIPFFGTIYYFLIPFFPVGIVTSCKEALKSLKIKKIDIDIVFLVWFSSVLICEFFIYSPNINKTNAIFVPLFYFVVNGIIAVSKNLKAVIVGVIILLFLNFTLFFHYYFYQYNNDSRELFLFATDYIDVVSFSKNLNKKEIFIQNNICAQPYIYVLLENQVPPYRFSKNNFKVLSEGFEKSYIFCPPDILQNDILQSNRNDRERAYVVFNNDHWNKIFKKYSYKHKSFGRMCVFYE